MVTVRMTYYVWRHMQEKIQGMFDGKQYPAMRDKIAHRMVRPVDQMLYSSEQLALFAKIPDVYLRYSKEVRVVFTTDWTDASTGKNIRSLATVVLGFPDKRPVPISVVDARRLDELPTNEEFEKLRLEWNQTLTDEARVTHEHNEFEERVRSLHDSSTTVSQFLKAFPEGEHLLPTDILDKYREKAPPRRKADETLEQAGLDEEKLSEMRLKMTFKRMTGDL